MKSQGVVEHNLARSEQLAWATEYKDIWIKGDMNLKEKEREATEELF